MVPTLTFGLDDGLSTSAVFLAEYGQAQCICRDKSFDGNDSVLSHEHGRDLETLNDGSNTRLEICKLRSEVQALLMIIVQPSKVSYYNLSSRDMSKMLLVISVSWFLFRLPKFQLSSQVDPLKSKSIKSFGFIPMF